MDRSAAIVFEMALILDDKEKCVVDSECDYESEWDDIGAVKKGKQRNKFRRVEGFFSCKSKVYLVGVFSFFLVVGVEADEVDDDRRMYTTISLTSLDMFSGISDNLINYAFNAGSSFPF